MAGISRWGARALTALVSLALVPVLVAGGQASAGELRFRDAPHDVQVIDFAEDTLDVAPDPTATNGDIRNVFIHYRKGRLVIRANYADLRPRADTILNFSGLIRTNENRRWLYQVETSPGRHAGHDELRTYRHFRKACEIGHFFDYRQNFTRVVVPLSCLSNPRWVTVTIGASTVQFNQKLLKEFLANDSAELPRGAVVARFDGAPDGSLDRLSWTPRVRR